ncbi:M10 family metallopeptidase C-terminal domain-containing protein [Bauldia sp.]|uniref:M10 family metallopeptidase C-terminal domain-containing protein n=1 Tax=Bauldia sp. TaxID=2575872 RepID=UPI003BA93D0B
MEAEAYLEWLYSTEIVNADLLLFNVLDKGTVKNVTPEKIVLTAGDNYLKLVFKGDFEGSPWGDPDLSGTVDGLKLKVNGTTVLNGNGFDIDAGELAEFFETPGGAKDILGMLQSQIGVFKGSQSPDFFPVEPIPGLVVKGRGGDDTIFGAALGQKLKGGKGNDLLIASQGDGPKEEKAVEPIGDKLFGGAGRDIFQFEVGSVVGEPVCNKIKDFSHKDDGILLIAIGTDLDTGFLDPDAFVIGEAATTLEHRIVYDETNGILSFDEDGIDGEDQVKFAEVVPGTKIKADDFAVVAELAF